MKDKKVIFFDIDGTIYDRHLGIIESTKNAISQLLENGHIPFICTGRTKFMVGDQFNDMGFKGMIAGCGTYLEYEDEVLLKEYMDESVVKYCAQNFDRPDLFILLEGPDQVYTNYADGPLTDIVRQFEDFSSDMIVPYDINHMPQVHKMTCHYLEDDRMIQTAQKELAEKAQFIFHESDKAVEIIPKEFSKGTAITHFLNQFGIPRENSYAFGDSNNDIAMMEAVDYSVAMGNSCEELFRHTKYKTKNLADDGIYYGLQKMGLIGL